MNDKWRLVQTQPSDGAWNMAVDEAILESVSRGDSLPTLRLYGWAPPCLSLGYAQPIADVDRKALQARGWGLVRRPTGGRAILHTDELTYAVIAPVSEPRVAGSVLESYRRLSQALLLALQKLGLQPNADREYPQSNAGGPVCFETPSNYEITIAGKKLIGSAQARRREGVLQHGSLPLHGDLTRITQGLKFADEAARLQASERLLEHATTVEIGLGRVIGWELAASAFVEGFREALAIDFVPSELTSNESVRADELTRTQYGNDSWNARI